jgi:vacuolar-type H+-ATPase subunit I/STV1
MNKDNLEILLEDIRGKFDLVLEGHEVLHKEIRDTRQELSEKIEFVDFKVEALNRKVDDVRDELNRKVDDVHDRLDRKVDHVHDALNRKIDDFRNELDQKIDRVESRLSQKIDAVAADLSAHRADTESHRPVYRVTV